MFFQWDEALNTGISEIDQQHRRIVDYINMLSDSRLNGADSLRLNYVLEQLSDYTVNHFLFEERLLERAGYEFLKGHQKTHELFTKRIADHRQRFAQGQDVTEEILAMLKNWLARHIMEEDMAYVATVKPVSGSATHRGWISEMITKIFG